MDQNNEPPKIVFEGEEFQRPARSFETPTPKIVRLVIKYSGGAVKDEKQANYFLIGFVAVVIIISLFLIFGGGNTQSKSQKLSDEILIQMTQTHVNQ